MQLNQARSKSSEALKNHTKPKQQQTPTMRKTNRFYLFRSNQAIQKQMPRQIDQKIKAKKIQKSIKERNLIIS